MRNLKKKRFCEKNVRILHKKSLFYFFIIYEVFKKRKYWFVLKIDICWWIGKILVYFMTKPEYAYKFEVDSLICSRVTTVANFEKVSTKMRSKL